MNTLLSGSFSKRDLQLEASYAAWPPCTSELAKILWRRLYTDLTKSIFSKVSSLLVYLHPKTLIEMWIICLDPVSANSEKGSGSEWAVRMGQRVPSRFGQSGAAREMNLAQIVVEAPAIRGGLPST